MCPLRSVQNRSHRRIFLTLSVIGISCLVLQSSWHLASTKAKGNPIPSVQSGANQVTPAKWVGTPHSDYKGILSNQNQATPPGVNAWTSNWPAGAGGVYSLVVDPANSNIVYAGTSIGSVYKSTDGGSSWNQSSTGLTDTAIRALVIDPHNSSVLYAGTTSFGIYKSTNGGASWAVANTGLPTNNGVMALAIHPVNSSTLYAVSGPNFGDVYRTTNGGGSWNAVLTGQGPLAQCASVAIAPTSPVTIYAGSYGFVYRSTDDGVTWNNPNYFGPPNHFRILVPDPSISTTIYAAVSIFAYKSTNSGSNWTRLPDIPSKAAILALTIDPTHSATIYAAIGTEVYKSSDGGTNWSALNGGLTSANVNALAMDSSGNNLYAGTDAGVFTYRNVSSQNVNPLIFIPGVAGSSLDKDQIGPDKNVWPYPVITGISQADLTLDPAQTQPNIYANDALRYVGVGSLRKDLAYGSLLDMLTDPQRGGYVEYNVGGDPARRTESGCNISATPKRPNLFVFAYDWRLSNKTNSQLLDKYVKCVQRIYTSDTKIDILTHSMGGLIARRYVLDHPFVVSRVITIAAPWLGAPKAINALETGDFFGGWKDTVNKGLLKQLVKFYPGAFELIPSRGFLAVGGVPFTESEWDADDNGKIDGNYTDYKQLVNELDHRFPDPASRPGTRNKIFHDYLGQDIWNVSQGGANPDPNVNYYHIYGVLPGQQTISNVATVYKEKCRGRSCEYTRGFYVNKDYGDGTVPAISASRIGNGKNFNALGVIPVPVCTDTSHSDLGKDPDVQKYVLSILKSGQPALPPTCNIPGQAADREGSLRAISAPLSITQSYYVTMTGATNVTAADSLGNNTAPVDGTVIHGTIPGVTTSMLDEDTFFLAMSVDKSYRITFLTGSSPLVIELTKGTAVDTAQAIRYVDLILPANVTAMLKITPQEIEDLRYDKDGDGIFESTISPTASVSGIAAQDTAPPSVSVTGVSQQTNAVVTVTSTDSGSGVKAVYYSLDGTQFQPYIGPFSVDLFNAPLVYAFADDNVANRSGLVIYYPSDSSNQVDNASFFIRQQYKDFLNRDPDSGGLGYWTGQITQCGSNAQCIHDRRVGTADAFFFEQEFQQTGAYAYRVFKAAFGARPNYDEFIADRSAIVVGPGLETSKTSFVQAFVTRDDFLQRFPSTQTGAQFVDSLLASILQNSKVDLSSQRNALIALYDGTDAGRAAILKQIAESPAFVDAEYNNSFVLMEYFGYLRRDPDQGGFDFWLGQVNKFPLRDVGIQHAMACSFITSAEYQLRFGSVVSHTNRECPH
jgi:photosystem II stability/assembly factor-like uncharacterized protein/pimeloyl-ACP methyl ester carboxylesterase